MKLPHKVIVVNPKKEHKKYFNKIGSILVSSYDNIDYNIVDVIIDNEVVSFNFKELKYVKESDN